MGDMIVEGQLDGELRDDGDVEQFVCAQCGGAANQRCTGCHITFYCSRCRPALIRLLHVS